MRLWIHLICVNWRWERVINWVLSHLVFVDLPLRTALVLPRRFLTIFLNWVTDAQLHLLLSFLTWEFFEQFLIVLFTHHQMILWWTYLNLWVKIFVLLDFLAFLSKTHFLIIWAFIIWIWNWIIKKLFETFNSVFLS